MSLTIPANTSATVFVPTADPQSVKEDGKPIDHSPSLRLITSTPTHAVFHAPSGRYQFSSDIA